MGALPFVAITIYAALSQVPGELVEAAEIDGARPWRVFFDVTLPILRPVLLILTSLSILWDFGVFTQPYLLIGQAHIHPSNYLMGVYLFEEGYLKSDYGRGAAISLLMLVMVAAMSVVYVRTHGQDRRRGLTSRAFRRTGWNIVGIGLFVVMVFPVFWMISTAFKPDDQINSLTPTWFSAHPTLRHFRRRDPHAVLLDRREEQPDHRAPSPSRSRSRSRSSPRSRSRSTASRAASSSSS